MVGILVKLFIFVHDNIPKLVAVSKLFTLLLSTTYHSHEITSMYPSIKKKKTIFLCILNLPILYSSKQRTPQPKKNFNGQKFTETGSLGTECRCEAYFPESQLLCRPTSNLCETSLQSTNFKSPTFVVSCLPYLSKEKCSFYLCEFMYQISLRSTKYSS